MAFVVATLMCALGANAQQAYACYTESNTTLTFYYDSQRSSRTGTTYDLNTGSNDPGWYTDGTRINVTQVVFDPSFADARPTTTSRWFYDMTSLQSIKGMSYLNTSEVTHMFRMFANCYSLKSLDVSHFNTAKVINMGFMFDNCKLLTSLDVSHFDTSEVTVMNYMFRDCALLTILDLSRFITEKLGHMNSMFSGCSSLTSLDLSHFNTANVKNMTSMFSDCRKLETIYVDDEWSTAAVTSSENMFSNCTSLEGGQGTTYDANHIDATYAHIDGGTSNPGYFTDASTREAYACYTKSNTTLTFYYDHKRSRRTGKPYRLNSGSNDPGWYEDNTYLSVTQVVFDPSFADARPRSTWFWFFFMEKLESITGMEYLNTSEVTNMGYMFYECTSLTSLDLSHFNTAKATYMTCMFNGLTALTSLDLSTFNTANVEYMQSMFDGLTALTSLDLSTFNTAKVEYMDYMFIDCTNLETIYVGDEWTTANVTTSESMFEGCTSLVGGLGTTYDANHVDATYAHIDEGTSNPGYFTTPPEAYACYTSENTTLTFYYDSKRSSRTGTTYDLNTGETYTGWDTDGTNKNVTQVVFDSSFADARPTTTYDWFYSMTSLQSIKGMRYLNTSEVTNMGYMFSSCILLKSIDVSSFNTANVTDMNHMFTSCYLLTSLDLSSFNTSNVTKMPRMFENCQKLKTIYVGDGWSTAAVTDSYDMFYSCTSLKGGQGTAYDANHIDKAYAHIDEGTSNPGYFTDAATGLITHIEAVPAKANTVKGIYTLDGRKLNDLPTQKGVYIIDGRRVVIK